MKVVLLSVAKPISRSCIMNFILKLTNSWFVLFFLCPTISLLLLYFIYIFCFIKQTPRSKCWLKTKQVRDNAVTPPPSLPPPLSSTLFCVTSGILASDNSVCPLPLSPSLAHFVLCYLGDTAGGTPLLGTDGEGAPHPASVLAFMLTVQKSNDS